VQPADLSATLLAFWRLPTAIRPIAHPSYGVGGVSRDRAVIVSSSGERALRTPAWYARFTSPDATELYAKPDDRWEVNEVSSRCSDVVEQLLQAESATREALAGGRPDDVPPLPDVLVAGME